MGRLREDKSSWFRQEGATATVMVPATPGSSLAKGLRTLLLQYTGPLGTQTKAVERPGQSIHTGVSVNNPFPREECGQTKCPYKLSGNQCLER